MTVDGTFFRQNGVRVEPFFRQTGVEMEPFAGWPTPELYVPAVHKVHAADCARENFPAGQSLHVTKG